MASYDSIKLFQRTKAIAWDGTGIQFSFGSSYIGVTAVAVGSISISNSDVFDPAYTITIKDEAGVASPTTPVVITTEGAQLIDGNATLDLNRPYQSVRLTSNGATLFSSSAYNEVLVFSAFSAIANQQVTDNIGGDYVNFGGNQSNSYFSLAGTALNTILGGLYKIKVIVHHQTLSSSTSGFYLQPSLNAQAIPNRLMAISSVPYPNKAEYEQIFALSPGDSFRLAAFADSGPVTIVLTPLPQPTSGFGTQPTASLFVYRLT